MDTRNVQSDHKWSFFYIIYTFCLNTPCCLTNMAPALDPAVVI